MPSLSKESEILIENYLFKKLVLVSSIVGGIGLIIGWFLNSVAVEKGQNSAYREAQSSVFLMAKEAATASANAKNEANRINELKTKMEELKDNYDKELKKIEAITKEVREETIKKLAAEIKSTSDFKRSVALVIKEKVDEYGGRLEKEIRVQVESISEISKKIKNIIAKQSKISDQIRKQETTSQTLEKSIHEHEAKLASISRELSSLSWIKLIDNQNDFSLACEYKILGLEGNINESVYYATIVKPSEIRSSSHRAGSSIVISSKNKNIALRDKKIKESVTIYKRCTDI